MTDSILFFFEVLVGGLLSGTMYSLVALGFVLIYKASSTFNFAQGAIRDERLVGDSFYTIPTLLRRLGMDRTFSLFCPYRSTRLTVCQ